MHRLTHNFGGSLWQYLRRSGDTVTVEIYHPSMVALSSCVGRRFLSEHFGIVKIADRSTVFGNISGLIEM